MPNLLDSEPVETVFQKTFIHLHNVMQLIKLLIKFFTDQLQSAHRATCHDLEASHWLSDEVLHAVSDG